MKYSSPKFNKEQLAKQKSQFINNVYNQLRYIQRDCKPFLNKIKTEKWTPIFIDKLLKFVCTVEIQTVPFLDHDYYISVNSLPAGRYSVFPCGDFELFDKQTKEKLVSIPTEEKEIVVVCTKFYVIETSLYRNVEQVIKTLPLPGFDPS